MALIDIRAAIFNGVFNGRSASNISQYGPSGRGRESYKEKQGEVLRGAAHLIEIDLLRAGPHVLAVPEYAARRKAPDYDYLVCVNRARDPRYNYELYPRRVRERLPRVRVPLA